MVKPTKKHRRDESEDARPGTKKNRPTPRGGNKTPGGGDKTPGGGDKTPGGGNKTPGDGDKTSSELTTSPAAGPSSDKNPVNSIESATVPMGAPRKLPEGPMTISQSRMASFAGVICPATATYPASADASILAPFMADQISSKGAGLTGPCSASYASSHQTPPVSGPSRGRKRRQRDTTPPETHINNLPLVTIVPPVPERPETGWRRGRPYWLINGATRLTHPILQSVDMLLETEARQQATAAWNATLERAVKGTKFRDLEGVPPPWVVAHLDSLGPAAWAGGDKGEREVEGGADADDGKAVGGGEGEEAETEVEGGTDADDGEAVRGGGSYVDASFFPDGVAGPLIGVGDAAQHDGLAPATDEMPVEQAGGRSGEPGQVSGEVEREPDVVIGLGLVMGSGMALDIEAPRDLPGWVDYEAGLVDPKYF